MVLVPYSGTNWNAWRAASWDFVRPWWEAFAPVFVGDHNDGPFNRGAAINAAARAAGDWDVAVIIDADVICDLRQIEAGVAHTTATGLPSLGYNERVHLRSTGSNRVIHGWKGDWRLYTEFVKMDSCSSANIVRRDNWEANRGYDELFCGWGWEDVAFKHSTETFAGGGMKRVDGTMWHLWHPNSPERSTKRSTFLDNETRGHAYVAATSDREAMGRLVLERFGGVDPGEGVW